MLKKKYFNDSFVLHDDSLHEMHLKRFFHYAEKQNLNNVPSQSDNLLYFSLKSFKNLEPNDSRSYLDKNWASFKNVFKFQPMWEIRNYFGESNAIYFAWIGIFITVLWFPSLIGLGFFIYGLHFAY